MVVSEGGGAGPTGGGGRDAGHSKLDGGPRQWAGIGYGDGGANGLLGGPHTVVDDLEEVLRVARLSQATIDTVLDGGVASL